MSEEEMSTTDQMPEEAEQAGQAEQLQGEFKRLVLDGKLDPKLTDDLTQLVSAGFCTHRSWGFGKITRVDTLLAKITIDFQSKPNHVMDLGFAAKILSPLSANHILARKASDLSGLKRMGALDHLQLIKLVLTSYGGQATLAQIQEALVPDIIDEDWKKWWADAKKEMKGDGHFQLPVKKSEPLIYHADELSAYDQLMSNLRDSKGLKAQLAAATEIYKGIGDVENKEEALGEIIDVLNLAIKNHINIKPSLSLEAILLRDAIRENSGLSPSEDELVAESVFNKTKDLAGVIEGLSAAKQKLALDAFRRSNTETWVDTYLELLNSSGFRLVGELVNMLIDAGHFDRFKNHLEQLVSKHEASTDLMLWLGKNRSDSFADILGPEVFRAMMAAIEQDRFNEKKTSKLGDFIMSDQDLVTDLIGSADVEVVEDLVRALQTTICFDDMDKRSILGRIVKAYPSIQSMISGDQAKEDNLLIVSWPSLERRKDEYEELVKKKIPSNSKEIAIARSYGDLRENHEFKAAKEMQKVLMARKGELEVDLTRARGTDFSDASLDKVSVGNKLGVTNLDTGNDELFILLGAWDGDPEKHILSYLTPLGQAFLGKKPGEETELEIDNNTRRYRINTIEKYTVAGPTVFEDEDIEDSD
ncbi:MAG: GreA/GreB family elongation factor [Verrucomicrobiota bacterium]|nr:GreA/GreB family elongation factor [Verrucomicrobiota bacterium]